MCVVILNVTCFILHDCMINDSFEVSALDSSLHFIIDMQYWSLGKFFQLPLRRFLFGYLQPDSPVHLVFTTINKTFMMCLQYLLLLTLR